MKKPDILAALDPVMQAFEKAGVPNYIAGSIASSAFGIARATLDVDLIADLTAHNAPTLVKMLKKDYYIDEEMILNAIDKRSSFNIIHLETMIKLDIFVPEDTPYKRAVFERRRKDALEEVEGAKDSISLISNDHIIISQLAIRSMAWLLKIDIQNVSFGVVRRLRPGPNSDTAIFLEPFG